MSHPATLHVRCPAKINLGLWILGRRPDGFHEIDTILQTVTLEDDLLLTPQPSGFSLETRGRRIPGGARNLIERAWDLIAETAERRRCGGIRVLLTKRIPVGAGLGGGSSDAAGFLAGANRALGLGLVPDELHALGVRLGSDVPFFFRGGTARATGRGERLRQLCPIDPIWVVLAIPPFAISTGWAYSLVRKDLTPRNGGCNVLESALASRDWGVIADAMRNVFEDVVLPKHPVLAALRHLLSGGGVDKALLAGSGSSLCGFVRSREAALALAKGIADRGAEVRVVRTLQRGVAVAPLG